jgi:hypothetical protein
VFEGLVGSTGCNLHNGSQERHRVEKTRKPKDDRGDELVGPSLKLSASKNQIVIPAEKTLLREIRASLPARRNLVHVEGIRKLFHGLSNVQGTLKTSIKVGKRILDFFEKLVHSLALKETHDNEWGSLSSTCE